MVIYALFVTFIMAITIILLQYYCLSLHESSLSLVNFIQSSRFDMEESPSLIKTIPTDILDDTLQSKYKMDTLIK